jgi:hypothetical protein
VDEGLHQHAIKQLAKQFICDQVLAKHCRWGTDDVSALSDARKFENADKQVLMRAFDKAVRRKPLAFAADAVGLWELHVGEGGIGTAGEW